MNKNDFPLLRNHPELIYLDNAATTQKPDAVIRALVDYYENQNANVHRGIYKLSEMATEQYENSRGTIAKFINAKTNEVIFTSGTTFGINHIALLLEHNKVLQNGDYILLSDMEHHSNILPWQRIATDNKIILDYVSLTDNFELNWDVLTQKIITNKPKIISFIYTSNVLGTINPIQKIIAFIRENSPDSIIIIDAAQSIGHIKTDVKQLDCDFLVFSGHKVYGPTGIGVIYGKSQILEDIVPIITGGGIIEKVTKAEATFGPSPHKFEAGTPNIAGAIGLACAINYLNTLGWEQISVTENKLIKYTLNKLKEIGDLRLFGPKELEKRIGVFSFALGNIHPHDIAQILDESNICTRAGHHCCQILHRDILHIPATLRVSLAFYNEISEIDILCSKLIEAQRIF